MSLFEPAEMTLSFHHSFIQMEVSGTAEPSWAGALTAIQ